jgi:hypothetical protein
MNDSTWVARHLFNGICDIWAHTCGVRIGPGALVTHLSKEA